MYLLPHHDLLPTARATITFLHEPGGALHGGHAQAVVRYVSARTADGRPYADDRLPLTRLAPV